MGGSSMSIEKTYDPVTNTYKFTTFDIVRSMVCGGITGGDDLSEYIYHDGQTPPTDAEVKTEKDRLDAEYDAQAYSRKREAEYPSIQECVHAILDDDLDTLQTKRAEIKKKYPKG